MNLDFNIRQDISAEYIVIKDTSTLEANEVVTRYTITYNAKDAMGNENDLPYNFILSGTQNVASLRTGMYISAEDFKDNLNNSPASIFDGVYDFSINVEYYLEETPSTPEAPILYDAKLCFYQQIVNAYAQTNLDYEWTARYKELNDKIIDIAEEMTRVYSLELSSKNMGSSIEFSIILMDLTNYYSYKYDY